MYLSQQRNFLFCHVPRTGGSSLFKHISEHVPDAERVFLQHSSMKEVQKIIGAEFDHLYKFAIVRNPWERLVSWHALTALNKVNYNKNSKHLELYPDSPHWKGFDEFLEKASLQKVESFRGDWLSFSQWLQLTDEEGNLLVNDIGRFENYAQDSKKFLLKIGVIQPFSTIVNDSNHLHYSEYYSNFGKELVTEVFKDDIVNFGYRFEDFQ